MPLTVFKLIYRMITDKTIRTLIPFLVVFCTTFFISGADIWETFGPRISFFKQDATKLVSLMTVGFAWVAIACAVPAYVLIRAWWINRYRAEWWADIYWQIGGCFFCFFLLGAISVFGLFETYLWLTSLLWLYSGIFITYMANTLWASRKLLYEPETPAEAIEKSKKFDELITLLKTERERDNETGDLV